MKGAEYTIRERRDLAHHRGNRSGVCASGVSGGRRARRDASHLGEEWSRGKASGAGYGSSDHAGTTGEVEKLCALLDIVLCMSRTVVP